MKKKKGSITIFSILSLLLVTATLFALLEATRLQEIRRFAILQTQAAIESVFANYNRCLWENYHLLGTSYSQMEELLESYTEEKGNQGSNLLRLKAEERVINSNTRLTDAEGQIFIKIASKYMEENFIYELGVQLYSQYESIQEIMDTSQMDVTDIGGALIEIENAETMEEPSSVGTVGESAEGVDGKEVLETANSMQNCGILELVIEDTNTLSNKLYDFSSGVLERELEEGEDNESDDITWTERILFLQYLQTYMSNYQDVKENRALSYETEYIIGKKSSDIENLKAVVNRILLIREAVNFLYLLSTPAKVLEAEAIATALVGITLNPVIIEMVKVGLLTAWAFGESILDVRALMAGKRIPLLKSEETWTMQLENMDELLSGFAMAKESTIGLDYQNYLGILLLLENDEKEAMKAMNLQEATIRKNYEDDSFEIDSLVVQARVSISYSYSPIFPFLRVIDAQERWEPMVHSIQNFNYY